ncbi:MAG: DUF6249 domain-containing protein [Flavobacteriaceae bacterium]
MDHLIIPVLGILSGIIIPIAVFTWLYHENKDKRKTVLEIAKHMDNPEKLDELMQIFEERKKEPIDYRRNGVITIFVGIGLYFFGFIWIGKVLEGIGFLVAAIGLGTLIAGYLYPNTEKELTNVVEKFEKR